jgi:hypothetical protein
MSTNVFHSIFEATASHLLFSKDRSVLGVVSQQTPSPNEQTIPSYQVRFAIWKQGTDEHLPFLHPALRLFNGFFSHL